MNADRNLLFGVLALQLNLVTQSQLVAGMHAWVADKQLTLAAHLIRLGHLATDDVAHLEPLVNKHVMQHGNDPAQSLAAISSVAPIAAALAPLAQQDQDIAASIGHFKPEAPRADDAGAVGQTTVATPVFASQGGRFRILRPHAEGGLGKVSVAQDGELGREVALKEIKAAYADDGHSRGRFVLEAEITGGLEHPNIVPVYSLGKYADGRPFYAMKFIQGTSLYDAVKKFHGAADESGRIKPRRVDNPTANLELRQLLGRLVDVCHAIAYAHSRGVLHRDLKPGNIMLGQYGETLVVDWGLAKALGESPESLTESSSPLKPSTLGSGSFEQTMPGNIVGTPQYMSPEQAAGKLDELGPATDVYAIGATLYHILTGQPPVAGKTLEEVLKQVREGDIPAVRQVNPTVAKPLAAICHRALSRRPAERYESAKSLADDIQRWLADEAIVARPDSGLDKATRWVRRNRSAAMASVLALMLIAGVSILAAVLIQASRNRAITLANENSELAKKNFLVADNERLANTKLSAANAQLKLTQKAERIQAEQLRRQLATSQLERGVRDCQDGRFESGLHLLIAGHDLSVPKEPLRGSAERLLRSWVRHAPLRLPHPGQVMDVGFVPGSRRAWTIADDTLHLWSTADWKLIARIKHPIEHRIAKLAEDFAGTRIAVATDAGLIQIFEKQANKVTQTLDGKFEEANELRFSADGRLLLAQNSEFIAWWDLSTGKQVRQMQAANFRAEFTPDGLNVVTYSNPESRIYTTSGEELKASCQHGDSPSEVYLLFGPDRTTHVTELKPEAEGQCGNLRFWSAHTGQTTLPVWNWHTADPTMQRPHRLLKIHPTTGLAVTTRDNSMQLWDLWRRVAVGKEIRPAPEGRYRVAFSGDGAVLAISGLDNLVRCYNTTSGERIGTPIRPEGLDTPLVELNRTGDRLLTWGFVEQIDHAVFQVWDVSTSTAVANSHTEPQVGYVSIASDGSQVLIRDVHEWRIRDALNPTDIRGPIVHQGSGPMRVTSSRDGTQLLTFGGEFMSLWDAETGASLGPPLFPEEAGTGNSVVEGASLSSDNSRIFSTTKSVGYDSELIHWKWTRVGDRWQSEIVPYYDLENVSSQENRMLTWSEEGKNPLILRDAHTGDRPVEVEGADLTSAQFSPDGKSLLANTNHDERKTLLVRNSGTAIYDASTGLRRGDFLQLANRKTLRKAQLSPDRRWLATMADESWWLWDLETLKRVRIPTSENELKLDSSAKGLLAISGRRHILIWDGSQNAFISTIVLPDDFRGARFREESELVVAMYKSLQTFDISSGEALGDEWKFLDDLSPLLISANASRVLTAKPVLATESLVWDIPGKSATDVKWPSSGFVHTHQSLDGFSAIVENGHEFRILNGESLVPLGPAIARRVSEFFMYANSKIILAYTETGVRRFDAQTGQTIEPEIAHPTFPLFASLRGCSTDGTLLVVGGEKRAQVWNLLTGKMLGEFTAPAKLLNLQVTPGPSGAARVMTACDDHQIRYWTVSGQALGTPMPVDSDVQTFEMLPNNQMVIVTDTIVSLLPVGGEVSQSGSFDEFTLATNTSFSSDSDRVLGHGPLAVGLWSVATSELETALPFPDGVVDAQFCKHANQFVVHHGTAISLFETGSKKRTGHFDVGQKVVEMALCPSLPRLATWGQSGFQLWDLTSSKPIGEPLKDVNPKSAVFSADGRWLIVQSETVHVLDALTGQESRSTRLPDRATVDALRLSLEAHVSPEIDDVLISIRDEVRVLSLPLDVSAGLILDATQSLGDAVWTPNNTVLAQNGQVVSEYAPPNGELIRMLAAHPTYPGRLAVGAGQLAANGNDGGIWRWDLPSGRTLEPVWANGFVWDLGFSPDGSKFWAKSTDLPYRYSPQPFESRPDPVEFWFQLWNGSSGRSLVGPHRHQGLIQQSSVSPNGRNLVVMRQSLGRTGHRVQYDDPDGAVTAVPLGTDDSADLDAVAWSPDGLWLALSHGDYVALWKSGENQAQRIEIAPDKRGFSLAFSPDSRRLTIGTEQRIWHWNLASLESAESSWRVESASQFEFSPDGTLLAFVTESEAQAPRQLLHVWDVASGLPLGGGIPFSDSIERIQFSPSSAWLLVNESGTARVIPTAHFSAESRMPWRSIVESRTLLANPSRKDGPSAGGSTKSRLLPMSVEDWQKLHSQGFEQPDVEQHASFRKRVAVANAITSSSWRMAATLLNDLIRSEPENPSLLTKRAEIRLKLRDFQGAAEDARRAITFPGDAGRATDVMLNAHANLGDWDSALAAAVRLEKLRPGQIHPILRTAEIHLAMGNLAEFRATRSRLLREFRDARNGDLLDDIAYLAVVVSLDETEAELCRGMAQRAVDSKVSFRLHSETLAAAEYRAGQFEAARERLKNLVGSSNSDDNTAWMYWFLALTQFRQGDRDAALVSFEQGDTNWKSMQAGLSWNLRIRLSTLRNELVQASSMPH